MATAGVRVHAAFVVKKEMVGIKIRDIEEWDEELDEQ